jgi:hypothetical protein
VAQAGYKQLCHIIIDGSVPMGREMGISGRRGSFAFPDKLL